MQKQIKINMNDIDSLKLEGRRPSGPKVGGQAPPILEYIIEHTHLNMYFSPEERVMIASEFIFVNDFAPSGIWAWLRVRLFRGAQPFLV